jgi:hypothetical protein
MQSQGEILVFWLFVPILPECTYAEASSYAKATADEPAHRFLEFFRIYRIGKCGTGMKRMKTWKNFERNLTK